MKKATSSSIDARPAAIVVIINEMISRKPYRKEYSLPKTPLRNEYGSTRCLKEISYINIPIRSANKPAATTKYIDKRP